MLDQAVWSAGIWASWASRTVLVNGKSLRRTLERFPKHHVWLFGAVTEERQGINSLRSSPGFGIINPSPTILVCASSGILVVVSSLWAISLVRIDQQHMSDLGLVSVLPVAFYAALGLLVIGFGIVIGFHKRSLSLMALIHIGLLIAMIHGTPAIIDGTLRYAWAWKHVGIVDYIQRQGAVDPSVASLSVYHNWPGFFAFNAFIAEVAGFESALGYANWAPLFFNLINVGALLLVLRSLTQNQRLAFLSVWVFCLGNWVAQDYFSPQATAFFLYLVVLGVCLTWFKTTAPQLRNAIGGILLLRRFAKWSRGIIGNQSIPQVDPISAGVAARAILMSCVILCLLAVVPTHQITTIVMVLGLGLLVAFRQIRGTWLPFLLFVSAVTWAIYMAEPFMQEHVDSIVRTFGTLEENVGSSFIDLSKASRGQIVVAMMGRILTALLGILCMLGGIRRFRSGHRDYLAGMLLLAPLPLFAVTSYGGEIGFRVYLFALPFVAFFAAALVLPEHVVRYGAGRVTIICALLSFVLLSGFLFAYYGKEAQYRFTVNEVEAAEYLYSNAPKGSLLIEGSRNYPAQFLNYEHFTYVPISREPPESRSRVIDDPVATLSRWMSNESYSESYLFITRSQKMEMDLLGHMETGSLARIEETIRRSPKFEDVYSNEDAVIFVLRDSDEGGEQ